MATKLMKLEELEEGEYEAPFGRVAVSRANDGYKIVIHIDARTMGKTAARQILQQFLAPAINGGRQI